MTAFVNPDTGDLVPVPHGPTARTRIHLCPKGHQVCLVNGGRRDERGCRCCECHRTTSRYADCYGCTVAGCPCVVQLEPWPINEDGAA